MKNVAYRTIRFVAYLFLEAGCRTIMLLARLYGQDAMYRIVETRHGFNVDFVIDRVNEKL